ncbi:MAG: LicD family protein [Actinomycetaceae bacterium]|nr:LicD family protein [Actinomycetaceae bacterium]
MLNVAKVKAVFRENRLTGGVYERLYGVYYHKIRPRFISRQLRRRGPDVLRKLCADLESAPMPVFAVYGTLLGFMREGRFISFDNDLDFGVLGKDKKDLQDLFKWMKSRGYHLTHFFTIDGDMLEFSIEIDDVSIDFFWFGEWKDQGFGSFVFFKDSNESVEDLTHRVSFLKCSPIQSISTRETFGIDVPIPSEPERFLEDIFTENWRIPDPHWVSENGPAWNELRDTEGILTRLS